MIAGTKPMLGDGGGMTVVGMGEEVVVRGNGMD